MTGKDKVILEQLQPEHPLLALRDSFYDSTITFHFHTVNKSKLTKCFLSAERCDTWGCIQHGSAETEHFVALCVSWTTRESDYRADNINSAVWDSAPWWCMRLSSQTIDTTFIHDKTPVVQELLAHVVYPILLGIAKVCSCFCFIFPNHADLCFFLALPHCKMYVYGGMSWRVLAVRWLTVNSRLLQCQFCLKEKAVSKWHYFSIRVFWISYLQIQLQYFSPLKQ